MKYIKFKIDTQWVKNHKTVNGWFILGQRSTDYNWAMLHEAASFENAKNYIRGIMDGSVTVYGPDSYEVKM